MFPRPRVVVSRCITFEAVRYDGSIIPSGIVELMKPFVEFIPVCPEVGIGLPVPRDPIRIVRTGDEDRLIQPATGRDLTEEMERFARGFLDGLPPVDGFILKTKSPSSGKSGAKVYPRAEASSPIGQGPGVFGREVLARFDRFPIEDEGRLRNGRIRDHFLTAIFTLARFREAKERGKIRDIVRFHTENQLLLMAESELAMRAMEKLVANNEGKATQDVFALYEDLLLTALRRPPGFTANINILAHAEGYFKDRLTNGEKKFFEAILRRYREGLSPVSEPKSLVLSWIARFGEPDLAEQGFGEPNRGKPRSGDPDLETQTYFSPYPEELILPDGEVADRKKE
jgi:uncharacterized protein YbbK (DUF523 family)/uncharacterized protein YbgA (DUF1722 family)